MAALASRVRDAARRFSAFVMRTMKPTTARDARQAARCWRTAASRGFWGRTGRAPSTSWKRSTAAERKTLFLSCGFTLFQVRGAQRALAPGDWQQGGIELHKRCIHGGVGGMATVAGGFGWDHLGSLAVIKAEEGPLAGEARLVLYVDFKAHNIITLEIAFQID